VADLKRWFKVWTSILSDLHFQTISMEDRGRWMTLGALIAQGGNNGKLVVPNGGVALGRFLGCEGADLGRILGRLPHINTRENDNGELCVTMKNWRKYQRDSTGYERLRKHRKRVNDNTPREDQEEDQDKDKDKEKTKILPVWLDPVIWEAFKAYRKKMRKPIEEEAIIKKLAKYHDEGQDPNEILEQTMVQGWQGLFPVKRQEGEETPEAQLERMRREGKL